MALPSGVTFVTNIKGDKGAKGDTGSLAFITAESVPADQPARVEMVGPESNRGAHLDIPRGLPGVNALPADGAVGTYIQAVDTQSRKAVDHAIHEFVRIYTPEMFGAIGDGVADDLPAFRALELALQEEPDVPARVQITRTHRVSTSINFDCEHLEIYLAAGSHVFNDRASSGGHALGIIGYNGLGTAVTPTRCCVTISGPGKVTGWLGSGSSVPNNENAIGIVRVRNVNVQGPQGLEAGRKAITTQYGIENVNIKDIDIERALHSGIAVEDGTKFCSIQDIRVGEISANDIILSAAEHTIIDGISAGIASGNGVRVTGTPIKSVQVRNVSIESFEGLYGVSIASVGDSSSGIAVIDNVRVDKASGAAVRVHNWAGATHVGAVIPGSSPMEFQATGTTQGASIRRFNSTDTNMVVVPAHRMFAYVGSPSFGLLGSIVAGCRFDATANETAVVMVAPDEIPSSWRRFTVGLILTNTGNQSGAVVMGAAVKYLAELEIPDGGTYSSAAPSALTAVAGQSREYTIIPAVVRRSDPLHLRVQRVATDSGDTLSADAGVVGIVFRKLD